MNLMNAAFINGAMQSGVLKDPNGIQKSTPFSPPEKIDFLGENDSPISDYLSGKKTKIKNNVNNDHKTAYRFSIQYGDNMKSHPEFARYLMKSKKDILSLIAEKEDFSEQDAKEQELFIAPMATNDSGLCSIVYVSPNRLKTTDVNEAKSKFMNSVMESIEEIIQDNKRLTEDRTYGKIFQSEQGVYMATKHFDKMLADEIQKENGFIMRSRQTGNVSLNESLLMQNENQTQGSHFYGKDTDFSM